MKPPLSRLNSIWSLVFILPLLFTASSLYGADKPGFFRYPATDGESVVFTSEGDLWKVPLSGGVALRLTTHEGEERFAHFSPDGRYIAFSEQDDGQDDVYLISAAGGEPRRLTFHPERDQVINWDPDGNIIFRSLRESRYRGYLTYRISPQGGWPESIGLDKCSLISFEPGGKRVAFNRYSREFRTWKRYRGGWAQDIWVGDIDKIDFKNLTDNPPLNDWDGTDAFPMWNTDGRIYFLSDRKGRSNIYSMLPDGSDVRRHTDHRDFDVRWPSLGGGVIVYQNGMDIWALNIQTGKTRMIPVELPSDRVQAREKFAEPMKYVSAFELSPDGKRLLLCSRGELFTAPAKGKGLIRQLTHSSGVNDKAPAWSPDGKSIAAWSDLSGEEMLYLYPASGGEAKLVGTDGRGWHFRPVWSPDGKKLAFGNEELELVVMDAASGDTTVVDRGSWEIRDYTWSSDSRYLAYTRPELNYNQTVRIWDSRDGNVHAVTDDFFNSHSPVFDPEGEYFYFLSDRIANPYLDHQEMTYILDKRTLPFVVGLKAGKKLPFAPEANPKALEEEEKPWEMMGEKGKKKKGEKAETVSVQIDFDGLSHRITPFPVEPGNYGDLRAVKGKVFFLSWENRGMLGSRLFEEEPRGATLHKFVFRKEELKEVAKGVIGYDISRDGEKLLIRTKRGFKVTGIDGGMAPWKRNEEEEKDQFVDLSQWTLRVDVRAEWKQIFNEAWRLQRDFFWNAKMHGVDWLAVRRQYAPLTERISTRNELNDLIGEMIAELNCSHTYVWGGDQRHPPRHSTGLLGVDVSRDKSGFYRIERIIAGRPWEKDGAGPLAAPGLDVKPGNYIVAVGGRSTAEVSNYLELLLDRAGKITSVSINDKPSLEGAREIVVKPLGREYNLRYEEWVDDRRDYVAQKSDGRIGYIHLTNMGGRGLSQFTRDYLPQHDKPALIMDVRYNGGGFVADMILQHLGRKVFAVGRPRHGGEYRSPYTAFHGYMVAVCNGETGSDGETFTEGFKRLGLGPVIGSRTWGGWVGIRVDKPFIDRGVTSQPEFTGWGLDRQWLIEGRGTEPDLPVKEDPNKILRGEDPQLDYAIEYLKKKLQEEPLELPQAPPIPDRSR